MTMELAAGSVSPSSSSSSSSSNNSNASSSSPINSKRNEGSPSSYHRYLKPGALAKLRNSRIMTAARRRSSTRRNVSSDLSFTPQSAPADYSPASPPLIINQDNGLPCFDSPRVNLSRPRCIHRKKLFAVTPFFALDDHQEMAAM